MPKPKDTVAFDMEAAIPAMVATLRMRLVLKKSDLKVFQVPAAVQEQVLSRLAQEGFETIKNGVRVPLRLQLETLLQERNVLEGPIGRYLKGGTPKLYRELLNDLAREGSIHLLIRGKAEAVTGRNTPVLGREELRALGQLATSVQKAQKSRPMARTLLREDVLGAFSDLGVPPPDAGNTRRPSDTSGLMGHLLEESRRLLKPDVGLCFVPELVMSCLQDHSLRSVHEGLWQAVRDRRLELRPESGMNRLSALELSLCPEGLQGSRLSWARPLETGA